VFWGAPHEFTRQRSRRDDGELVDDFGRENWHSNLPAPPGDFSSEATFELTPQEADYLTDRVRNHATGTMIAFLLDRGSSTDCGYRRAQQWRLDMQTAQSGCERCEPCEGFGPRTKKNNSKNLTMGKNVHTRSHVHTDCNHIDPSTFEHRDGKAFCPGCDRYMGRVQAEGTDTEVAF
jgi:hypothetical protein